MDRGIRARSDFEPGAGVLDTKLGWCQFFFFFAGVNSQGGQTCADQGPSWQSPAFQVD